MGEETLDLRRYFGILSRRWWLILLLPLLAGGAAYLYSKQQTPIYEASTLVLVQETRSGLPSFNDFQASQQFASTYRVLLTTRPMLEAIVQDNDLDIDPGTLGGKIFADLVRGTQFLRIGVRDTDPQVAAKLSNAVAHTFIQRTTEQRLAEIAKFQSAALAQGLNSPDVLTAQLNAVGSLQVVDEAAPPGGPIPLKTRQNVLLAIVIGLMFAIFTALVLEYIHDTVQSPERIERRFGVVGLGSLPAWPRKDLGRYDLWIRAHPTSGYAEAVRHIKSSLQFVTVSHPTKTLLITSAGPSEGKSTVAANLALALAEGGLQTVLVDLDLRRPSVHRFFDLDNTLGVTTYLARPEMAPEAALQGTAIERLRVLTSGPIPPNPSELLTTSRMEGLLDQLRKKVDIVILDTPPLLVVADASLVARRADSAILVTDGPRTRMESVRLSLESLKKAGVPVFTIVNKLKLGFAGYAYPYRYYRYYRYRSYYRPREEDEAEAKRERIAANGNGHHPDGLLQKAGRLIGRAR